MQRCWQYPAWQHARTTARILPTPKYDENQSDYCSYVYHGAAMYAVPTSAQDPEFSGFILEALAEESHRSVTDVYYEETLKNKYQRDESSSEMLDIVFRNRIWDMGYLANLGNIYTTLKDSIAQRKDSFASSYEKKESKVQKAIEDYIASYENANTF